MEVRYTPGDGMLLARGARWLLLGVTHPPAAVLDQLWHDLGQPAGVGLALDTIRRDLAATPLAWLDATTGDHDAVGGATVSGHGDRWELTLGGPGSGSGTWLRLVDGVVAAASLHVTGHVPASGDVPAPTATVIDGIPPEILAAQRPVEPHTVRREPPAPPPTADPEDADHDHHTRRRSPSAPAPSTTSHLEQSTADTVLAVRCGDGHLTDPLLATCRTCGNPVPPQEPARVLRPPLGALRLPDGDLVLLDRPVVLGRHPAPTGPGDWPHLVRLPHDSTYLSRLHLRIDLDGWHVLAQDLGSRGGTTLFAPGRDPEKIRAHEPHLLESGTTLDLAGAYRVTYLSTVEEVP